MPGYETKQIYFYFLNLKFVWGQKRYLLHVNDGCQKQLNKKSVKITDIQTLTLKKKLYFKCNFKRMKIYVNKKEKKRKMT